MLERSKSYKLANYVKYVAYVPTYCAEVKVPQRNRIYFTSLFLIVY